MKAIEVYEGSDGDQTTAFYAMLEKRGAIGTIAVNLFRAAKCSARAKLYGKGSFQRNAYDRKNWSIGNLCNVLKETAVEWEIVWGWKEDHGQEFHNWVLYCDLPDIGQVSFHSAARMSGPDYPGEWDREHKSAERICLLCDRVALIIVEEDLVEQDVDGWVRAGTVAKRILGEGHGQ